MPAICLNELANYNNGKLVYKWFDLEDSNSADEYHEAVQEWLDSCPHPHNEQCEEWCVGDVDDIPEQFYWDYGFNAEQYFEFKAIQDEVGEDKLEAWMQIFNNMPESAKELESRFYGTTKYPSDDYRGFYVELGEQIASDNGLLADVPEEVSRYFDYEKYGRDHYMDMAMSNGFIFWNN